MVSNRSPRSAAGSKTVGNYLLSHTLGEGTFGKVKAGVHLLTGEKVAVKVLEKERILDKGDIKRVTREIQILKHIRHPNIVHLLEVIEKPRHIYLVTEHVSGGELFDFIVAHGRLQETQACHIFRQIIQGVDACHAMGVAHRDLKPENLLIDEDGNIKIIDFGLSNTFDGPDALLRTACGSPCYAAPEMIAGRRYSGATADMWSLGVCLFAMLCGYLPFEDPDTGALYKKIMAGTYKVAPFVSSEAADLIRGMLTTEPAQRFGVSEIHAHAWMRHRCATPLEPPLTLHPERVPGVLQMPIEEGPLREIEAFGFSREYCTQCLAARKRNHITATYHLLHLRAERQRKAERKAAASAAAQQQPQPTGADAAAEAEAEAVPTGGAPARSPRPPTAPATARPSAPPPPQQQQAHGGAQTARAGAGGTGADGAWGQATHAHKPTGLMVPRPPSSPAGGGQGQGQGHAPRRKVGGAAAHAAPVQLSMPAQSAPAQTGVPAPPHARAPPSSFVEIAPIGQHLAPPGSAGGPGVGVGVGVKQPPGSARAATGHRPGTGIARPSTGRGPASARAGGGGGAPGMKVSGHGMAPGSAYAAAAAAPPRRPATATGAKGGGSRHARPPSAGGAGTWGGFSGFNGAPNLSRASGLPPKELMAEALRVLELHKVAATVLGPFVARCERHSLVFELETAAVDSSQKTFVVRLQLSRGDPWLFKELCSRLLPALRIT